MLCDACLMRLYLNFKDDGRARKAFFALTQEDFPTIETLIKTSGLTGHQVRAALNLLRGSGLVWGSGCHGLSESGHRLLELLCDTENQPEPAEALCDDCLLEISLELPGDAYAVLATLADRMTHSRHNLILSTGITSTRAQDVLWILAGAQLIQSSRGRSFRLSATGRRFERLLQRRRVLETVPSGSPITSLVPTRG